MRLRGELVCCLGGTKIKCLQEGMIVLMSFVCMHILGRWEVAWLYKHVKKLEDIEGCIVNVNHPKNFAAGACV